MTIWPEETGRLCGCRRHCGDLDESLDDEYAVCKGLARPPRKPDVEIVVVPRAFPSSRVSPPANSPQTQEER